MNGCEEAAGHAGMQDDIREGTLAGKLERLGRLQAATAESSAREAKLVALLATANDSPCPAFSGARGGQVREWGYHGFASGWRKRSSNRAASRRWFKKKRTDSSKCSRPHGGGCVLDKGLGLRLRLARRFERDCPRQ